MRTAASGWTLLRIVLLSALLLAPGIAMTQDPDAAPPVNLPAPTLGGKQLWADVFLYADWRIQEHVWTGHVRLLDPDDGRRGGGTYVQGRAVFETLRRYQASAPANEKPTPSQVMVRMRTGTRSVDPRTWISAMRSTLMRG